MPTGLIEISPGKKVVKFGKKNEVPGCSGRAFLGQHVRKKTKITSAK